MTATSRLIATEEHFLTDAYIDETATFEVDPGDEPERSFMANFPKNPVMRDRLTDLGTRLDEMDAAGIDTSVLSLNPPAAQVFSDPVQAGDVVARMNDELAGIVASHPGRFHGLGSLAPQVPLRAADEVKRIMGPLGLGGVMISSHTHGRYLDEPEFEPVLAALEEEDATLYLHPRSPSPQMIGPFVRYGMIAALWGFQAEASTHALRLILSGTLDRHPNLRVVLGHLGEGIPCCLWRLDNIYAKTRGWAGEQLGMVELDLAPSEYVARQFWVTTSGMFDPAILRFVVDTLGADRVAFAVDYPYEDSPVAVRALDDTPMTASERERIGHGNAESLFRIPAGTGEGSGR